MIALLEEGKNTHFPNPNKFDNKGLVAISQHLGVERILQAYRNGIFPWMKMEWEPHYWCWFSPNPRMVLVPSEMKISRSLRRIIDSGKFEIRIDSNFESTMKACARAKRPNEEGTWIEEDMISDYSELHKLGHAHSIEAYQDDQLVGGLYGLAMGRVFFGESMFHEVANASKVCLAHLVSLSLSQGIKLIDCQVHTHHLESLGAKEIPRSEYLISLHNLLRTLPSVVNWKSSP